MRACIQACFLRSCLAQRRAVHDATELVRHTGLQWLEREADALRGASELRAVALSAANRLQEPVFGCGNHPGCIGVSERERCRRELMGEEEVVGVVACWKIIAACQKSMAVLIAPAS